MDKNNNGQLQSFSRRSGRVGVVGKQRLENLSAKYCIEPQDITEVTSQALFGNDKPLIIEIGFGMADATYQIAMANPDKNYLGFEVHLPGVARLLGYIDTHSIENIKIISYDVKKTLFENGCNSSIDGFHIFFPDPWQKMKHHKRRLLQENFLIPILKWLKPDGYLYFVSDWQHYAEDVIELLSNCDQLESHCNENYSRFDWRPMTKFEKKGISKGHRIYDILYKKGRMNDR